MSRRPLPVAAAGFLAFCGLSAVASIVVATSGADDETLIWGEIAVGAAYGVGALVVLVARSADAPPPRRSSTGVRLGLAAAYLGSLGIGLPVAGDAAPLLLVAPLLHLIGAGCGLCGAAVLAIGTRALGVTFSRDLGGSRRVRVAGRAFAAALGVILLAVAPGAALDTFAYDSPYDGRRGPDWPLLLVGHERPGVVVHHPDLLVAARIAWWLVLAGIAVLLVLLVATAVAARRRPEPASLGPARSSSV